MLVEGLLWEDQFLYGNIQVYAQGISWGRTFRFLPEAARVASELGLLDKEELFTIPTRSARDRRLKLSGKINVGDLRLAGFTMTPQVAPDVDKLDKCTG